MGYRSWMNLRLFNLIHRVFVFNLVLDLLLRSVSKGNQTPQVVRSIESVELVTNSKSLDGWVDSVVTLHSIKIPKRKMVDLESLMQVWPTLIEEYLTKQVVLTYSRNC
jgi:hypothetical protein